jgi:hypothetical protein
LLTCEALAGDRAAILAIPMVEEEGESEEEDKECPQQRERHEGGVGGPAPETREEENEKLLTWASLMRIPFIPHSAQMEAQKAALAMLASVQGLTPEPTEDQQTQYEWLTGKTPTDQLPPHLRSLVSP